MKPARRPTLSPLTPPPPAARLVANLVYNLLKPACQRLDYAGSIRRGVDSEHDIDLLAVPCFEARMVRVGGPFANLEPVSVNLLWARVDQLVGDPASRLTRHPPTLLEGGGTRAAPWGPKYRKLQWCDPYSQALYSIDLLTTAPEWWGAAHLIRTGPRDFARAWVTELGKRGLRAEKGRILDTRDTPVPCPDELAAFGLVGWTYRAPERR